MNEPVGVIGVVCPDEAPLLALVSLIAPAMAMGNAVIAVPSRAYPLIATDLYQVFDTSDVPGGVVNIVTGGAADLGKALAGHMDVEAMWSFADAEVAALVERESVGNLKRTWVNHGAAVDWGSAEGRQFLTAASEIKTIWVPYGE